MLLVNENLVWKRHILTNLVLLIILLTRFVYHFEYLRHKHVELVIDFLLKSETFAKVSLHDVESELQRKSLSLN